MKLSPVKVEGKYGHGAIPSNRLLAKIRHSSRRQLGKASAPYPWSVGYDVEQKVGLIPKKDQGSNDSCGGQAGSYFLEVQRRLQGITEAECSAKSVYAPIAYPGGGTTVSDLQTQIAARGSNLETEVPSYDANGNPLPEPLITEKSWMTPALITSALKRAGYTPVSVSIDMDSIALAIQTYGGVIWEIQGQNNGTWLSVNPKPPSTANPNEIWAHFMCGKSAVEKNGVDKLGFFQSYGSNCGDQGVQYFTQDYIDSGYIVDCFTFVSDKNVIPVPTNLSLWAAVCDYFRRLWGLSTTAFGV